VEGKERARRVHDRGEHVALDEEGPLDGVVVDVRRYHVCILLRPPRLILAFLALALFARPRALLRLLRLPPLELVELLLGGAAHVLEDLLEHGRAAVGALGVVEALHEPEAALVEGVPPEARHGREAATVARKGPRVPLVLRRARQRGGADGADLVLGPLRVAQVAARGHKR